MYPTRNSIMTVPGITAASKAKFGAARVYARQTGRHKGAPGCQSVTRGWEGGGYPNP